MNFKKSDGWSFQKARRIGEIRTGFWYVNVKEINTWEYLGADMEDDIKMNREIMIGSHGLD